MIEIKVASYSLNLVWYLTLMNDNAQIYVCSFYSKKFQYQFAANRFENQALKIKQIKKIYLFNEKKLFNNLSIQYPSLEKIFLAEKKNPGLAWFAWKPIVILETLKLIPLNSILLYADIGCNLRISDNLWNNIQRKAYNNRIITAYSFGPGFRKFGESEYCWTKPEIFRDFEISVIDQNSPQYQATWVMMSNNELSYNLIQEWVNYCTRNNFFYVKPDTDSNYKHPGFVKNMCDQSVFSCLIKKNSLKPYVADNDDMSIIEASRNLSLFGFYEKGFVSKIVKKLERRIIALLNLFFKS